jgi:hypothetical protein
MFPVCEALNPKDEVIVNHYWLFNLNIRDKKYQILDSMRKSSDPGLKKTAILLCTSLVALWELNYPKSKICNNLDDFRIQEIEVPKQTTK